MTPVSPTRPSGSQLVYFIFSAMTFAQPYMGMSPSIDESIALRWPRSACQSCIAGPWRITYPNWFSARHRLAEAPHHHALAS